MSFLSLLRRDRDVLAFGFAFTFASSLGQTFFISLFVPGPSRALGAEAPLMAVLYGVVWWCPRRRARPSMAC